MRSGAPLYEMRGRFVTVLPSDVQIITEPLSKPTASIWPSLLHARQVGVSRDTTSISFRCAVPRRVLAFLLMGMMVAFAAATARVFAHVASFPMVVRTPLDPTLTATDLRRRATLLNAVTEEASGWPETDRKMAAGLLDVLWSVMSYERLVTAWDLAPEQATTAITWVIGLVETAIREGRGPGGAGAVRKESPG